MAENKFSWGVARSAHVTRNRVFPAALPYVLSADGMRRIMPDGEVSSGAVMALRRHAESTVLRPAWVGRRRAA